MRARNAWILSGLALVALVGAGIAARVGARPPDPSVLLGQVHQAVEARDWERAATRLDQLDAIQPPGMDQTLLRAEIARGRGRPQEALAILEAVPDSAPGAARARLYAGQIERDRARLRLAEAHMLAALKLDPGLVQARRELIFLYGMQARRAALREQFRVLADQRPLNHNDMMMWTASHEDIWANTSIEGDLRRFLAADPDDRWSRLALAEVLLGQGRIDEGEAVLRPLPDSDVETLAFRAQIALDRLELEKAQTLLAEGPVEHARLARLRGRLAIRRNDPAAAVEAYRVAARLDPANREALQGLALAQKIVGAEDEAADSNRRAETLREIADLLADVRLAKGQADPALPRRLGVACEALGLIDEARGWYRLAVAMDPLNADAQHALFRLREPAEPEVP